MFKEFPVKSSGLEKFLYELQMLNEVYPLARRQTSKNRYEQNAGIESFLVHTRNLVDFLGDVRGKVDDLTCSDFVDVTEKAIQAQLVPQLDLKTKIHKHLAHLTKTRTRERVGWDLSDIRRMLNEAALRFLVHCAPAYFKPGGQAAVVSYFSRSDPDRDAPGDR